MGDDPICVGDRNGDDYGFRRAEADQAELMPDWAKRAAAMRAEIADLRDTVARLERERDEAVRERDQLKAKWDSILATRSRWYELSVRAVGGLNWSFTIGPDGLSKLT